MLRPASASGTAQPLAASAAEARSPQETGAAAEGGPVLDSGVDLQGMIDSIRATIEIATKQGMGQARIALQPAELGQIRIHLTQTSDGLLARVTADTPAAAQALAASRGELHQSLSSLGTSLLGLDIGSFKQPERSRCLRLGLPRRAPRRRPGTARALRQSMSRTGRARPPGSHSAGS